jgi:hypothetical protein
MADRGRDEAELGLEMFRVLGARAPEHGGPWEPGDDLATRDCPSVFTWVMNRIDQREDRDRFCALAAGCDAAGLRAVLEEAGMSARDAANMVRLLGDALVPAVELGVRDDVRDRLRTSSTLMRSLESDPSARDVLIDRLTAMEPSARRAEIARLGFIADPNGFARDIERLLQQRVMIEAYRADPERFLRVVVDRIPDPESRADAIAQVDAATASFSTFRPDADIFGWDAAGARDARSPSAIPGVPGSPSEPIVHPAVALAFREMSDAGPAGRLHAAIRSGVAPLGHDAGAATAALDLSNHADSDLIVLRDFPSVLEGRFGRIPEDSVLGEAIDRRIGSRAEESSRWAALGGFVKNAARLVAVLGGVGSAVGAAITVAGATADGFGADGARDARRGFVEAGVMERRRLDGLPTGLEVYARGLLEGVVDAMFARAGMPGLGVLFLPSR